MVDVLKFKRSSTRTEARTKEPPRAGRDRTTFSRCRRCRRRQISTKTSLLAHPECSSKKIEKKGKRVLQTESAVVNLLHLDRSTCIRNWMKIQAIDSLSGVIFTAPASSSGLVWVNHDGLHRCKYPTSCGLSSIEESLCPKSIGFALPF